VDISMEDRPGHGTGASSRQSAVISKPSDVLAGNAGRFKVKIKSQEHVAFWAANGSTEEGGEAASPPVCGTWSTSLWRAT
jgi:hypothetical protein